MKNYAIFKKYIPHVLNILLFVSLLFYSLKYGPKFIEYSNGIDPLFILFALLVLFFIVILCAVRWLFLLKIFNKRLNLARLTNVYIGSNLYKYIPPKGINYIIRNRYVPNLPGRISTMFGEFITEISISAIFFLITLLKYFQYKATLIIIVLFSLLFLSLLFLSPLTIDKLLFFLPKKIAKLRKLFRQFHIIRKSKYFYISMFVTLVTAFLHGIVTYLLLSPFITIQISFWDIMLVFYSAQFLSLLLLAPAGLGARDITMVGLFSVLGISTPLAIMITFLYRILMFISEVIPGMVSIFLLRKKKSVIDPSSSN